MTAEHKPEEHKTEHHETTHVEKTTNVQRFEGKSFIKDNWGIITALVVGLLIIGGIFFFWNKKKDNPDIAEIRDAFPNSTSTSQGGSSTGRPFFFGNNSTSTPPAAPTPKPTPTPPAPTPRGPAARPSTVAGEQTYGPTVYKNDAYGYQVSLPGEWASGNTGPNSNKAMFFNRSTGGMVGYVEVYENTSGETIDSLERILQGSPDTSVIARTSVNGIPAIHYQAGGYSNIAVIQGNKIYYLHNTSGSNFISHFRFN
jgi:hypothetical protein